MGHGTPLEETKKLELYSPEQEKESDDPRNGAILIQSNSVSPLRNEGGVKAAQSTSRKPQISQATKNRSISPLPPSSFK